AVQQRKLIENEERIYKRRATSCATTKRVVLADGLKEYASTCTGGNIVSKKDGIIGISDHGGWAVLVTVARDGTLVDRRRVELVDEGMPKIPHHSEGQGLPIEEAVELVERVRVSAEKHAVLALDAVTTAVPRIL